MITLHLNHGNSHEGVYLRLPATPGEVGEAFSLLDSLGDGKVTIFDVDSPVRNLRGYIMNADVEDSGTLSILQNLAHRICDMSPNDIKVFAGALDSESMNGAGDVLRVANNLDQYIMLHGVTNYKELGAFLVDSGYKNFPEHTRPYLNYEGIGAEYYAERGGAFTPEGYVQNRTTQEQAPISKNAVITLSMATPSIYNFPLSLPATEEEMDDYKYRLGVDDFARARIIDVEYSKPYLADLIPKDCISVEDANDLALGIEEMQQRDGELIKFLAVLEVEQPDTFPEALQLATDLDDYERITEGTYEYGQTVLRRHGADDELLDAMEGYMDFEKLGEDAMVEDGVRHTEFGLLRRCSTPFPEESQSMQMGM